MSQSEAPFQVIYFLTVVFWEQQGIQIGIPKIQLTRSFEATELAFQSHFESLSKTYGNHIHVINLLGRKVGSSEAFLSKRYQKHIQSLNSSHVPYVPINYTPFDMNATVEKESYDRFSDFFLFLISHDRISNIGYLEYDLACKRILKMQQGVFRLNCLDCLDRTNVIQSILSRAAFLMMLCGGSLSASPLHAGMNDTKFLQFNSSWADNGDTLSYIYTGTGALKSGFTRTGRRTFAGFFDDLRKSTHRFYINNFQDKFRQRTVDFLLGKGLASQKELLLVSSSQLSGTKKPLDARSLQNGLDQEFSIYSCTFNLHAVDPENICFDSLLRPLAELGSIRCDLFCRR